MGGSKVIRGSSTHGIGNEPFIKCKRRHKQSKRRKNEEERKHPGGATFTKGLSIRNNCTSVTILSIST